MPLVLTDKFGNVVHFGERDCSIQRRNQKLLEEDPSPALTAELRKAMGDAAVAAAAASIGYIGVGTIEFVLDERGSFYFMEINTRIQVENSVTEMISSVDLIEQIRVARGEKLRYSQDGIVLKGHSIECRIYAEDAFKNFRPGPGIITSYLPSGGPFMRIASHVYPDYVVPSSYDSLLGKDQARKNVALFFAAAFVFRAVIDAFEDRKFIVNATFTNGRVGLPFILDAANGAGYVEPEVWHLCDPDAEKVSRALRKAGVKVVVVSNFDTRLRPLLRALKCHNWFDAVAVSAEVEAEKPNPTIFFKACELLGVQPDDDVHVGDDRRNDIWGARDVGCDAWLWGSDVNSLKEVCSFSLGEITSAPPEVWPSGMTPLEV